MHTESPIFRGIDKFIGTVPWYGLSIHSREDFTYSGSVKPLTKNQLAKTVRQVAGAQLSEKIRQDNLANFGDSDCIVIVLDGRANGGKEGYLGDMIEATRLIRPLSRRVKEVIIATSNPDIFEGTPDNNISILPIPDTITGNPRPPWDYELRRYLYESIGETPCIFPLNANNASYAILGPDGRMKNEESFAMVRDAMRPGYKGIDIDPMSWCRRGIHQLQALQIMYYLLGSDEAQEWDRFPDAYLYPSPSACSVANEVINLYGCFETSTSDCPPVYLHIGVATNGRKLRAKYYPEEKWVQVLKGLAENPQAPDSVTFLEPSDPLQSATTLRLATSAVESGLHVAKIPMSQLKSEWTLGSFIAFLQELSKHKGIIVGCDSMPAGHAGPAVGNASVVLGSPSYNPGFYCPPEKALIVMPSENNDTSGIRPKHVVNAIIDLCHLTE